MAKSATGNGRKQRTLDLLAARAARDVVAESTRLYLERIVAEAVKQDLEDPAFRAELREAATRAHRRVIGHLRRRS